MISFVLKVHLPPEATGQGSRDGLGPSAVPPLSLQTHTHLLSPPSTMLLLPDPVLDRLHGFFESHDALALSATCKQLYPRTTRAYRDLRFRLESAASPSTILARTLERMNLLLGVLRDQPRYRPKVRSIELCGPPLDFQHPPVEPSKAQWHGLALLLESLDFSLAQVIELCTDLRRFVWSNYAVGAALPASATLEALAQLRHLRVLDCFHVQAELSSSVVRPTTICKPEEVSLDCGGTRPYWCIPFLMDNAALRSLRLVYVAEYDEPQWLEALCWAGES